MACLWASTLAPFGFYKITSQTAGDPLLHLETAEQAAPSFLQCNLA